MIYSGMALAMNRIDACLKFCEGIETEELINNDLAEYVSKKAFINGMSVNEGAAEINLNGLACQLLASSFAGQFVGRGAINFLTVDMSHPEIGKFTVTMQKDGGTSVSDKLKALKKYRDYLIDALKQITNVAFDCGDNYQSAKDAAFAMQEIAEQKLSNIGDL